MATLRRAPCTNADAGAAAKADTTAPRLVGRPASGPASTARSDSTHTIPALPAPAGRHSSPVWSPWANGQALGQGGILGDDHKHWFRAKFFQQYPLFFRYHASSRVIVFAWVNDEDTKRAYESADDAYRVFRRMLDSGRPPSDWGQLLAEARALSVRVGRLVE